jgi:hypothetical protein
MNLEEAVFEKLKAQKIVLCTIESCTGGLIAHLITDIAGASEVLWGSWVTYDNSSKIQLGVSETTLTTRGAVSPEVANELARSGLRALERAFQAKFSDPHQPLTHTQRLMAISTTGIAGPSGGSPEKPVGLCYSAIISTEISPSQTSTYSVESTPITQAIQAPANLTRIQTKRFFAQKALESILSYSFS